MLSLKKLFFLCSLLLWPILLGAEEPTILINEIAWMGTENSGTDEWIELYNSTDSEVNLTGWRLEAVDGSPKINFYEGSIREEKDKMILELEWGKISLPTNIYRSLKEDLKSQEVVMGFRPQIVKIVKEGKAIGKAEVDIIEPLGSDILVYLKLGNDICRALVPIDTMITEGEVVDIDLDLQRILLFDKKTGIALF